MLAATFAAAISFDLWHMPIQVYDSLAEILDAQQSPSVSASFSQSLSTTAYLRPLRIAQIKALFDLSGGNYRLAYRGSHVLWIVALLLLFARALQVRSRRDLAPAALALTVLTGLHTFHSLVREAYPINHFLEIAVACLAVLNLSQSRGGWLADLLAGAVFVAAALTLESGLLVWVVAVCAWIAGLRGVSTRGLAIMTALLAGYFALRFAVLATGLPTLSERSSGFLLQRLEPDELQRRFGDAPVLFYAYNVAASVMSVLFSEPRDGVFATVRSWTSGDVRPREYVAVVSSLLTTLLIAWWAVTRWRERGVAAPSDRLLVVAGGVLLASAALGYAYTKDEIMAVAGVCYALAAFAAVRGAIERAGTWRRPVAVSAVSACLFVLASLWAVRAMSVHHVLSVQAFKVRNDWAEAPTVLRSEDRWPSDPAAVALVEALRTQAIDMRVRNAELVPEWQNRWFGD